MRAVAQLRRNVPTQEVVYIKLRQQDDAALAQALERNDYVNKIVFFIDRLPQTEPQGRWDNLRRVLATREKLEKVHVRGLNLSDLQPIPLDLAMVLQAVQQNTFLRSMRFSTCDLASGEIVSSFLDAATSLTQFDLQDFSMTMQGAGRIAESLRRHTALRTLSLRSSDDSHFSHSHLTRILQGLETNSCLQSLSLRQQTLGQNVPLAREIQRLLERTSSIQCLEWNGSLFSEASFRPICEGLIRSATVSQVRLEFCSFTDPVSVDLFRQLLETKPNLRCVHIKRCAFPGFPDNSMVLLGASLQAALLRPNSPLRTLDLRPHLLASFFPGLSLGALLSAVGRSSLEGFCLGYIWRDEQFQTLLNSLPAMKIVNLEFQMSYRLRADRKQFLLEAVKQNFSLRSLKASFVGSSVFTDDDENLLQFYLERNERLAQWVANPGSVPRLLWPEALGLALESGEDTLYRSLQAVLGESTLGQRKRKRQADKDKMNL